MEYRYSELFDDKIKNKVLNQLIFIENKFSNKSSTNYFEHIDQGTSFKIGEMLKQYLPFCVYSEEEYLELYSDGALDNVDLIIEHIKNQRLPKRTGVTNGIYSETLLDMLIMFKSPKIKKACIRTLHRQKSDNNELKGFDSIHILSDTESTYLLFGQAKLGDRAYCISGIKEDIKKMDFLYTYSELAFIADKRGSVDEDVQKILRELNRIVITLLPKSEKEKKTAIKEYFESRNIKIIVPCLLTYEKSSIYDEDFEEKYYHEIESIIKSTNEIKCNLDLDIKLSYMFFPIFSKADLRRGMGIDE